MPGCVCFVGIRIIAKNPPMLADMIVAQRLDDYKKGCLCALKPDLAWVSKCEFFSECVDRILSNGSILFHVTVGGSARISESSVNPPFANIVTQWPLSPALKAFLIPLSAAGVDMSPFSAIPCTAHVV